MRSLFGCALYLAAIFVGGALLAPILHHATQALAAEVGGLTFIAKQPFASYVNRSFLAVALGGLWPFLKWNGLNSWRKLGLLGDQRFTRQFAQGLMFGFLTLALVASANLVAGPATLALPDGSITLLSRLAGAGATALFVAALEELVFRAALFGALRQGIGWPMALMLSGAIYAGAHFLKRAPATEAVHWNSGLIVLGQMASGASRLQELVPAFVNLMLAGLTLGIAYQRSRSLYLSIGIHAGWIFWIKTYGLFTKSPGSRFWGGDKLIDGWLACLILGLGCASAWLWAPSTADRRHRSKLSHQ